MDFLPFYIYWILGGDISSRFEACRNSISGENGICISQWSCTDIAKGFNIGPCLNKTSICCKIHNSDFIKDDYESSLSKNFTETNHTNNPITHGIEPEISPTKFLSRNDSSSVELQTNNTLTSAVEEDFPSKFRKMFAFPVEYRKPVVVEKDHDLRRPVEQAPDSDLRRPVRLEESHDLRWNVVEEDSHDLRNPIIIHQMKVFNNDLLKSKVDKNVTSKEDVDSNNNKNIIDFYFQPSEQLLSEGYDNCKKMFDVPYNIPFKELSHRERETTVKMLKNVSEVCGISYSQVTAKLAGGRVSAYLQWPWMVSLRKFRKGKFRHMCGATLLTSQWVITAAHCVQWTLESNIMLRLGSNNLNKSDEPFSYVDGLVHMIYTHPKYNTFSYENDIALLQLRFSVEFRPNIAPICLPHNVGNLDGKTAVVLGWGKSTDKKGLSGSLQDIYLPLLSNKECERMYAIDGPKPKLEDGFMCAGTSEGGRDACEGDSGGPMAILNSEGRWSLIGLVSWGRDCAAANQPGVYTRVTKYVDWIKSTIVCYDRQIE